jgi:hypothetical protein
VQILEAAVKNKIVVSEKNRGVGQNKGGGKERERRGEKSN